MPSDFSYRLTLGVGSIAGRHAWDTAFPRAYIPGALIADDGYESLWLPRGLLMPGLGEVAGTAKAGARWRRLLRRKQFLRAGLAGGQEAYWGVNYARLREIKRKYDPDGLFFIHHGVGSEEWSRDGFTAGR